MKTINRLALAAAMILTFSVAQADVVVVVSAKSPASKLTKDQVTDIFLGRSTSMVPLDQAAGPRWPARPRRR
jgi:ABC-type phosphate transport system substrate-binding protein